MTQKEFNKLSKEWQDDTGYYSNMASVVENEAAKKIIEAGEAVLPFIINEIRETYNGHYTMILSEITECNPTPGKHRGKIKEMAKSWIRWYDNVYLPGESICGV